MLDENKWLTWKEKLLVKDVKHSLEQREKLQNVGYVNDDYFYVPLKKIFVFI